MSERGTLAWITAESYAVENGEIDVLIVVLKEVPVRAPTAQCAVPRMNISLLWSEELLWGFGFYEHFVPPGLKDWSNRQCSFVARTLETQLFERSLCTGTYVI